MGGELFIDMGDVVFGDGDLLCWGCVEEGVIVGQVESDGVVASREVFDSDLSFAGDAVVMIVVAFGIGYAVVVVIGDGEGDSIDSFSVAS